jgi:hypothetical protein
MTRIINLAAIALTIILLYGFSCWNSVRKIDNFCNSVGATTTMGELRALARTAGVDLYGPFDKSDAAGRYLEAVAPSSFAMGGYACDIRGDSLTSGVTHKHLGR